MPTIFDAATPACASCARRSSARWWRSSRSRDEAEAIRLANDTPYGLSGSIWSRDIGRRCASRKAIQAGVLSVNTNSSVHTEAPFGGYKMSGIGRELGMHAMELYTEVKNVFVDLT